jgi:hypothetical protein
MLATPRGLTLAAARSNYEGVSTTPPLCPSCGQPASQALAGPEHGWECRNEACPEFGQALDDDGQAPSSARERGRA